MTLSNEDRIILTEGVAMIEGLIALDADLKTYNYTNHYTIHIPYPLLY